MMGMQANPTPIPESPTMSSRPDSIPTSGLLVEVYVLQHEIDPVSHSLTVTGGTFGGG